jgi:hypothetical protein
MLSLGAQAEQSSGRNHKDYLASGTAASSAEGLVPTIMTNFTAPMSYPLCISGTTKAPFTVSHPADANPLRPSSDSAELSTSGQNGAILSDQSADLTSWNPRLPALFSGLVIPLRCRIVGIIEANSEGNISKLNIGLT